MAADKFVDLTTVLAFVDRTVARGAPVRVALTRASKRYDVSRPIIRAAYRSEKLEL